MRRWRSRPPRGSPSAHGGRRAAARSTPRLMIDAPALLPRGQVTTSSIAVGLINRSAAAGDAARGCVIVAPSTPADTYSAFACPGVLVVRRFHRPGSGPPRRAPRRRGSPATRTRRTQSGRAREAPGDELEGYGHQGRGDREIGVAGQGQALNPSAPGSAPLAGARSAAWDRPVARASSRPTAMSRS